MDDELIDIDAEAEALAASDGEPATKEEIRDWIYANMHMRARSWLDPAAGSGVFGAAANIDRAHAEKVIPRSDLNAAREISAQFHNLVTHVPRGSVWRVWNGVYHERFDDTLLLDWLVKAFIDVHREALSMLKEHYETEASVLSNDNAAALMKEYQKTVFGEHRAYRDAIHKHYGLTALSARVRAEFTVSSDHFDNDRRWLVCKNGVIDLHALTEEWFRGTGCDYSTPVTLLEHDPARPVHRSVNAAYVPGARSPRWEKFLSSSVPDASARLLLQVATGACMSAPEKLKLIPVLRGPINSGKSIFLEIAEEVLGGYAANPHNKALEKTQGVNFSQEVLRGMRFLWFSEPDTMRSVDDGFLKSFSGGDKQRTRAMYMAEESWSPQGVIFIATNFPLKFQNRDTALRKRFATIPFPFEHFDRRVMPDAEHLIDEAIKPDVLAECSGVLNWMIHGLMYYRVGGIPFSAAVEEERSAQLLDSSSVRQWLEAQYEDGIYRVVEPGETVVKSHQVAASEAYTTYSSWAAENLEISDVLGKRRFNSDMQEIFGKYEESGRRRVPRLIYAAVNDAALERMMDDI